MVDLNLRLLMHLENVYERICS